MIEDFVSQNSFFHLWRAGNIDRQHAISFLEHFHGLVGSFPPLIALAAARVDEASRVVLAENLFDECGAGDIQRTHYAIFRKFLESAGIRVGHSRDGHAMAWRSTLWNYLATAQEPSKLIGAIAAGEFLAQPALSRIYVVLRELFPNADDEYFTHHLELEAEHVAEIIDLIAMQTDDPTGRCVVEGFTAGLEAWDTWFSAMAAAVRPPEPEATARELVTH